MPHIDPQKAKENKRRYYLENKEIFISNGKERYKKNRDDILVSRKRYYKTNKESVIAYQKEYYEKNKLRVSARNKKYIQDHRKQMTEYYKKHAKENAVSIAAYKKWWEQKNRPSLIVKKREYKKHRMDTDTQFKLTERLRSRLYCALKGNFKSGSAVRDLGCTIPELKFYLEGKFTDGMSWDNWSLHGWHVDHIIPLAFFDLTSPEQLKQAVHYTNLQPLWAVDNITKSAKLPAIIKTV